jgi:hypothetical protein
LLVSVNPPSSAHEFAAPAGVVLVVTAIRTS